MSQLALSIASEINERKISREEYIEECKRDKRGTRNKRRLLVSLSKYFLTILDHWTYKGVFLEIRQGTRRERRPAGLKDWCLEKSPAPSNSNSFSMRVSICIIYQLVQNVTWIFAGLQSLTSGSTLAELEADLGARFPSARKCANHRGEKSGENKKRSLEAAASTDSTSPVARKLRKRARSQELATNSNVAIDSDSDSELSSMSCEFRKFNLNFKLCVSTYK